MKRLTKIEIAILQVNHHDKYNTYQCHVHGIYQIRKDIPKAEQVCPYCKKENPALSQDEIENLIKL